MISTGIKYLDRLSGGLRLGDNVVWSISDGIPIEHFTQSFMAAAEGTDSRIVYINFNYSPHTVCKRFDAIFKNGNVTMIDAFTRGKGKGDDVFLDFYRNDSGYDTSKIICVDNPGNISSFISAMNSVQAANASGSLYVFDSLTGMSELWKDEQAVLDFFSFTCPKLYDLDTVAYWVFEREAHSREFIAGLTHITQVVLTIDNSGTGYYDLGIRKLEGRPSLAIGGAHSFRVLEDRVEFQEARADTIRIGKKLKELRKLGGVTQAELAQSVNMTPGAISQIENDIIAPSLTTLVHLASFFSRPLEFFIDTGHVMSGRGGFTVLRGNGQEQHTSKRIKTELLADDAALRLYRIRITSGETMEGPILFHKGKEIISILSGSLRVRVDGRDEFLKKGESMILDISIIEEWSNPGKSDCDFVYLQF